MGLLLFRLAGCRAFADADLHFNGCWCRGAGGRRHASDSGARPAIRSSMTCGSLTASAVDDKQHVAGADTGAIGRAFAHHTGDQGAVIVR
jgi:hypothetical protein